MVRGGIARVFIGVVAAAIAVGGFALRAQGRSAADGVYSQEQAERGRTQYESTCASCHGARAAGSDVGPALSGAYFLETWSGVGLNELYTRVRSTMPVSSPGSLSPRAYIDVIAYLLQVNKFPAGQEELQSVDEILKSIAITAKK